MPKEYERSLECSKCGNYTLNVLLDNNSKFKIKYVRTLIKHESYIRVICGVCGYEWLMETKNK